jgi:serine/threonine protein phosphatase PrpC
VVPNPAGTLEIAVGNVGDSRAYWLPDAGAGVQLTTDDSWAAEAIAHGVPRDQAERLPQAHAITRWLGLDAPDPVPRPAVHRLESPGWVLVCSDGLWNYASDGATLAGVVADRLAARPADGPGPHDPLVLARELVAWAIEQGGSDNITVALARFEPVAAPGPAGTGPDTTAGPATAEPDRPAAPGAPRPGADGVGAEGQ